MKKALCPNKQIPFCLEGMLSGAVKLCGAHRKLLLLIWDIFMFAVVGLNSFILLLHRSRANQSFSYVVCAGAALYFFVLLGQTILLLRRDDRHERLVATKRVLRLVYTAIYLTSIMLEVIPLSEISGNEPIIAYKGFLFFWAALWGTNFLWLGQVCRRLRAVFAADMTTGQAGAVGKTDGSC